MWPCGLQGNAKEVLSLGVGVGRFILILEDICV